MYTKLWYSWICRWREWIRMYSSNSIVWWWLMLGWVWCSSWYLLLWWWLWLLILRRFWHWRIWFDVSALHIRKKLTRNLYQCLTSLNNIHMYTIKNIQRWKKPHFEHHANDVYHSVYNSVSIKNSGHSFWVLLTREKFVLCLSNSRNGTNCTISLNILTPRLSTKGVSSASSTSYKY